LEANRLSIQNTKAPILYTLGYGHRTPETFLAILAQFGITVVYDVRSIPASKHNPAFNRQPLQQYLEAQGLRYFYGGDKLGGKPASPDYLNAQGKANYNLMQQNPAFQEALGKLCQAVIEQPYTIALLCGEYDAAECHRSKLIGTYITAHYPEVELQHITSKLSLETQREVMGRVSVPFPLFG